MADNAEAAGLTGLMRASADIGGVLYQKSILVGSDKTALDNPPYSNNPSYVAVGEAYAGYATPTDMLQIRGSATKTVIVTNFIIGIGSTAAALQTIYFIKRSTANTGGTESNPPGIPYDTPYSPATAQLALYSVIPASLGTVVGNMRINKVASTVLTAAPANTNMYASVPLASRNSFFSPIILRGVAESLCINYGGAALTAGFLATWSVEWAEF